jgi:hypothetical protein
MSAAFSAVQLRDRRHFQPKCTLSEQRRVRVHRYMGWRGIRYLFGCAIVVTFGRVR